MTAAVATEPSDAVVTEDRLVPGPSGAPEVSVRVYRPARAASDVPPGLFYIHGGGMILGNLDAEDAMARLLCEQLEAVVVSTGYRKAPEDAHPAQVNDCYAALSWMAGSSDDLGYDAGRLAVYGASAGGNLALATALIARDRGGPVLTFVCSIYPMVDPSNTTASSREITDVGIWDRDGNVEGVVLVPGEAEPDAYAAPLQRDLWGLPPMFIDVGDVDLFRDEDITLVQRLVAAGVQVEFHLYPGAYHASEVFAPDAQLSRRIVATRVAALRRALGTA